MSLMHRRSVFAPTSDGTTRTSPILFHTGRPRPIGSKLGGWDYSNKNGKVKIVKQPINRNK